MVIDVTSIEGRVDQHTLLKEDMNHKTNVNTSPKPAQANVVNATLRFDVIRQQAFDVEGFALDAQLLMEQIHVQLDRMFDLSPEAENAVAVIDCFVKCALRNVTLITVANISILTAAAGGAI